MDNSVVYYDAMIKDLLKRGNLDIGWPFALLDFTIIIGFLKYVPMHYSDQITCIVQSSGE